MVLSTVSLTLWKSSICWEGMVKTLRPSSSCDLGELHVSWLEVVSVLFCNVIIFKTEEEGIHLPCGNLNTLGVAWITPGKAFLLTIGPCCSLLHSFPLPCGPGTSWTKPGSAAAAKLRLQHQHQQGGLGKLIRALDAALLGSTNICSLPGFVWWGERLPSVWDWSPG